MRTEIALLCLSLLAFTACVEGLRYFQDPDNIWNVDVSGSPVHPNSANIMQFVVNNGGFAASNNEIRIDFSVVVNVADGNTPRFPITKSGYNNEECDADVPNGFPLPTGGAVEGGGSPSPSYTGCSGDCHVLVYHPEEAKLYESYQSNFDGSSLSTSCVVQWNLCHKYGLDGRGEQCTSVEAAGLSFTAGVVRPSEVANDDLNHAMRLVLANSMIGKGSVAGKNQYVHPATHAGGPTATDLNAPLYGTRFRLKASKDLSGLSAPLQVIGNALKKYGLIIADGTGVPAYSFIFELDGFDSVTWDSLGIYQKVLSDNGITASDFEVVEQPDYPTVITYDGNCQLLSYPTDTCTITNGTSQSSSSSSSSSGCMLTPSFAELL